MEVKLSSCILGFGVGMLVMAAYLHSGGLAVATLFIGIPVYAAAYYTETSRGI